MASVPPGVIGNWDDVMGKATPQVRATAEAVRHLIRSLHPDAVEVARPGDNAVSFGFGPRKMLDSYAYLAPQRGWLNLGFYHGASLPDPLGLLEGTGKALRHVKVSGAVPEGVEPLLRAALAHGAASTGRSVAVAR